MFDEIGLRNSHHDFLFFRLSNRHEFASLKWCGMWRGSFGGVV